jgi:hypothetical protein
MCLHFCTSEGRETFCQRADPAERCDAIFFGRESGDAVSERRSKLRPVGGFRRNEVREAALPGVGRADPVLRQQSSLRSVRKRDDGKAGIRRRVFNDQRAAGERPRRIASNAQLRLACRHIHCFHDEGGH